MIRSIAGRGRKLWVGAVVALAAYVQAISPALAWGGCCCG